jgi:hypothetical protein
MGERRDVGPAAYLADLADLDSEALAPGDEGDNLLGVGVGRVEDAAETPGTAP